MKKKICILDYGLGNIRSLYNSLKKLGYNTDFYSEAKNSIYDILFIPGVGSFNSAINLLKKKNLISKIEKFNNQKTFIFGICLGMQILLTKGYENGENDGLNYINGKIVKFDQKLLTPMIGWNTINFTNDSKSVFLKKFDKEKFYFIHSYYADVINKKDKVFSSMYKKFEYTSVINKENILGTQFHPEKSGEVGLNFIENVLENI